MLGKIVSIIGDRVRIKLEVNVYSMESIMGKNVIFDNADLKIVGEILEGDYTYLDINLIGEIKNNKFVFGSITKPSFKDPCRIISKD